MTNTRDLIMKLKEVREEKGLSYTDIMALMEKNNDFLSKATLSRVFAEGSEENSFKYEETIRPIAKALLDMETIEDEDDITMSGIKTVLKYKMQIIEDQEKQISELQAKLDKQKVESNEKFEKERETYSKRIDFLLKQIELKDNRMDFLLDSVKQKDELHNQMLERLLSCSECKATKNEGKL